MDQSIKPTFIINLASMLSIQCFEKSDSKIPAGFGVLCSSFILEKLLDW